MGHVLEERLRELFPQKVLLAFLLKLLVAIPYYSLQHHVFFPVTIMEPSLWDRLIPFTSNAIWSYHSIYLLVPIAPFLMVDMLQLRRYAVGMVAISLIANFIFIFWPTLCPRPYVPDANWGYRLLVSVDAPLHAFPSLHAAFAVYTALCCEQLLREARNPWGWRMALWFWVATILYSTLALKQHVLIDLIGGGFLACLSFHFAFGLGSLWEEKPAVFVSNSAERIGRNRL